MIKYKLTTQNLITHGTCQWTIGNWKHTNGKGYLCGPGFLHYYHHPLLAMIMNPVHANIHYPRLFEVDARGTHRNDRYLKGGCNSMKLIRELEIPTITTKQLSAFIILYAKEVDHSVEFNTWADDWLSNKDRTVKAMRYVYDLVNPLTRGVINIVQNMPYPETIYREIPRTISHIASRLEGFNSQLDLIPILLKAMKNEDPDYKFTVKEKQNDKV